MAVGMILIAIQLITGTIFFALYSVSFLTPIETPVWRSYLVSHMALEPNTTNPEKHHDCLRICEINLITISVFRIYSRFFKT